MHIRVRFFFSVFSIFVLLDNIGPIFRGSNLSCPGAAREQVDYTRKSPRFGSGIKPARSGFPHSTESYRQV